VNIQFPKDSVQMIAITRETCTPTSTVLLDRQSD
jgi:hypothetical protein